MKAITIWQPWATLIAIGAKRFETRGWATRYRGPIAIHAAKHIDGDACLQEPIYSTLREHGYLRGQNMLPRGEIVAVANLVDCLNSIDTWTDGYVLEGGRYIYSPEYEFGDFTPGRFAWEMKDIRKLDTPIPAKGQQGLWNWEEPT